MKILEKIEIKHRSDLIYTKNIIKTIKEIKDTSYYIFAAMELGTNLLKHADKGYIYLLQEENHILLASLDYGSGIKDMDWALKKGTSSKNSSLGMGLYQLTQNENFNFEIFTLTEKAFHGTVAVIYPKDIKEDIIFFTSPYLNEKNSGDFFAKKGKFLIFGDASGHSYKSKKSADLIIKYFYKKPISCIIIDDFFKEIDGIIRNNEYRGAVFTVIEKVKNFVQICGVGDLNIFLKKEFSHKIFSLKKGIVGEKISSIGKYQFELKINEKLILTTDGIDMKKTMLILNKLKNVSNILTSLSIMHFAGYKTDDKSILIISP